MTNNYTHSGIHGLATTQTVITFLLVVGLWGAQDRIRTLETKNRNLESDLHNYTMQVNNYRSEVARLATTIPAEKVFPKTQAYTNGLENITLNAEATQ